MTENKVNHANTILLLALPEDNHEHFINLTPCFSESTVGLSSSLNSKTELWSHTPKENG